MASIHTTVMPGSFSFDTILPTKLDLNVGGKSHFFQPPKTPSASSSLHTSTASLPAQDIISITSRKRSRHDSHSSNQTPIQPQSHAMPSMLSYTPSALESPSALSPAPFVNTQYRLAGGLDTPTVCLSMDEEEDYPASPDLHLRGGRGCRGFELAPDGYFPQSTPALSRESNGRPRKHAAPRIQDGLGKAVYGMVSVAGKMWDFCRTFRGFYAGGIQGYEMKPSLEYVNCDQSMWQEAECDEVFQSSLREKSLVSDRFLEEDFVADYMSQNHTTPPRAAKKIQREKGIGGEISASWVLVTSRETSPSRLSSRKIPSSNSSARRAIPKLSRRPILPASRPSLTSYAGSPGLRSDRTASFASPRSPLTSPTHESLLSAEAQRQAARIRKRELEEDTNLKRFNQQLKAMIKEGKEALGTKFEVFDEPVDEGYAGGDHVYGGRKN
ncbi:MAG: hypothetical protein ALECFALPRED_005673 [Alectoria fallacina]|uniref:Uncharacterized protein n=1 Tax=Alectoria fallacina TaxID=1903189 RepID=A0A8H3G5V6_9LECA|nr:MAG: hypothetical protein ALECFALPRED_005673 [Alectoria fallacina]